MRHVIQNALHHFGYEIHRTQLLPKKLPNRGIPIELPSVSPIWPLPRHPGGPSDDQIREEFAKYDFWHYSYAFDGGLSFPIRYENPRAVINPQRARQRFMHFFPYLMAVGGSLRGKRVLDIACNSGFWSIQCALLGAEVVGFDGRPELIQQAELIKSIVWVRNVEFKVMDFWEMSSQSFGGTFDIVLNLGILYHLTNPLEALRLTISMARKYVVLDTEVYPSRQPVLKLVWEESTDFRTATSSGIVTNPSKSSIDLMLRHIGAHRWFEIPLRTTDMPRDYLDNKRASWLIEAA